MRLICSQKRARSFGRPVPPPDQRYRNWFAQSELVGKRPDL